MRETVVMMVRSDADWGGQRWFAIHAQRAGPLLVSLRRPGSTGPPLALHCCESSCRPSTPFGTSADKYHSSRTMGWVWTLR